MGKIKVCSLIMTEDKDKAREANKIVRKAKSMAMMKNYDKSISFYKQAIEIFDDLGGFSFQIKRFQWEINKLNDLTKEAENVKADLLRRKASTQKMKEIAEHSKLNSTQSIQSQENENNEPRNSQKLNNGVRNSDPVRITRNKGDIKQ